MRMLKHDGEVTELKGDQYSGLLLNLLHYHNFTSKFRHAQRPVLGHHLSLPAWFCAGMNSL
jgi:hypothetical protein